jgi:hypothetical protein
MENLIDYIVWIVIFLYLMLMVACFLFGIVSFIFFIIKLVTS